MKAMILAAGRGERLRPLTDRTPKPLIEVGQRSLIEHHLIALAAAGVRDIIVNLAWLGEAIEQRLGDGQDYGVRIRYSREPQGALETAGGIRNALAMIGDAPFLVVSSDVLTDFPFGALVDLDPPEFGHLVLVDNQPHHPDGDFGLVDGRVTRSSPRWTFSGIGLFRPQPFARLGPGRCALRPLFEAAIDAGQLSAEHYAGRWLDVGTPERLSAARRLSEQEPGRTGPTSPPDP
jgi:MurNAc alpha-1-phosphate uridylyltransferase